MNGKNQGQKSIYNRSIKEYQNNRKTTKTLRLFYKIGRKNQQKSSSQPSLFGRIGYNLLLHNETSELKIVSVNV